MNPWLIGVVAWLGFLVLVWLFFAGVALLESLCAQWEENEIHRIAEMGCEVTDDDADWADEMRRRKGSGAS